jgi:Protein of unknown function (DUF3300)
MTDHAPPSPSRTMKRHYFLLILGGSFAACAADLSLSPLYPDTLIAIMFPAAAYPVEIVLAARFVADTYNLATLDEQPWDENVEAVARIPAALQKMEQVFPLV